MAVASGSRSRGVHLLPRNIEQLAVDCLSEDQYQVALTFLDHVIGPTVTPSASLLRQLLVLSSCKSDPKASDHDFVRVRRRKRSRTNGESGSSLPEGMPLHVTSSSLALLRQYLNYDGFATTFLDCLTLDSKEDDTANLRFRRSRSRELEDADVTEEEPAPLADSVQLLIGEAKGDVWNMLKILNAQSKNGREEYLWHLPSHRPKKKNRSLPGPGSSKAGPAAASSAVWSTLLHLAEDIWSSRAVELDDVEDWRDDLADLQRFQSERCWKLVDVFVTAWHTQGSAQYLSDVVKDGKMTNQKRSELEALHLVQQMQSRNARLPLDDAGEALDVVFAGLCNLESWTEQPCRLHISKEGRQRRAEIAGRLFLELARLSNIGAIDRQALVRGVQERLVYASTSGLTVFMGAVEHNEAASRILAEALKVQSQMTMATLATTSDDSFTEEDLALQKELVFRALEAGITGYDLQTSSGPSISQAYNTALAYLRLARHVELECFRTRHQDRENPIAAKSSPSAIISRMDALQRKYPLKKASATIPVPPAKQKTQVQAVEPDKDGRVVISLLSSSDPSTTSESESSNVPESEPETSPRKSTRMSKPPVRTGLRKLPTHGMSRGKPPFRKERDPSTTAESSTRKRTEDGGTCVGHASKAGQVEGKPVSTAEEGFKLDQWLLSIAKEEWDTLQGFKIALQIASSSRPSDL